MHPNRAFAWTDRDAMLAHVAEVAFCTLFVAGEDGPRLLHVPVVVHDDRHLRFHVARSNRAAPALDGAEALLSCLGPDAYVSPDWYGTADQVPTWNYVAVECTGRLRRLDQAELVDHLDSLSAAQEARLAPKPPWTRGKMDSRRFEAMTRAIAGYELAIAELRGTLKLGQHKKPAEREGAAAGVLASGREEMARLMRPDGLG